MTRHSGSEREPLAEPCQDETVGDTPFILGHLAEVTWLWGKLGLPIPWWVFSAGPRSWVQGEARILKKPTSKWLASTGMFMSKLCAYFGSQTRWTRLGAAWLNIDGTGGPEKQESWVSFPGLSVNLGAHSLGPFLSYADSSLVRQGYGVSVPGPREQFPLSAMFSRLTFPRKIRVRGRDWL